MYEQTRAARRRARWYSRVLSGGFLLGVGLCSGGVSTLAHAAGPMMCYPCDDALKKNKQAIVNAAHAHGATDEDVLYLLAMAMQESQCCSAKDRDASKDGTPGANYSCFNMNGDMLTQIGWNGQPDLNDDAHVDSAVYMLLLAFHKLGRDGVLNFHRGGRTAYQDGTSYGAAEYREAMKQVVQYLHDHPWNMLDNMRVAFAVGHV